MNELDSEEPLLEYPNCSYDILEPIWKNNKPWRREKMPLQGLKSRAREKMRGAANVFDQWPSHITSVFVYSWFVLVTFVFFSVAVYGLFVIVGIMIEKQNQSVNSSSYADDKISSRQFARPQVYCQVVRRSKNAKNISEYRSALNVLSKSYPDFDYNLLILLNDIDEDIFKTVNADRITVAYSDIFQNMKLNDENNKIQNDSILVKTYFLSEYLENTPIKDKWKTLNDKNNTIRDFAVLLVSAWNDGGITINSNKLLEDDDDFNESLYKMLDAYKTTPKKTRKGQKSASNIIEILKSLDDNDDTFASEIALKSEETHYEVTVKENTTNNHLENKIAMNNTGHTTYSNVDVDDIRVKKIDESELNVKEECPESDIRTKRFSDLDGNVFIEENGNIIAAKSTCNVFIAQLFKMLGLKRSLSSPSEILNLSLDEYCNHRIKFFPKCDFIHFIKSP